METQEKTFDILRQENIWRLEQDLNGLILLKKRKESEDMRKMENIKYAISAIIGVFFSFFGILAVPLALLIPCNIIDYFTGLRAAKMRGEKITSEISINGIYKKVTMYILIFVGFGIDCMISYVTGTLHIEMAFPLLFAAIVASWLVINELISITENCEVIGVTIPILGPVLKYVKKKIETVTEIKEEDEKPEGE